MGHTAIALLLLNMSLSATADTRIRGEFEYNVDEERLSEWNIGPKFSLSESVELELPLGQDDGMWLVQPELTYEIDVNDVTLEMSIGLEVPFANEPIEGSGSIESSIDF